MTVSSRTLVYHDCPALEDVCTYHRCYSSSFNFLLLCVCFLLLLLSGFANERSCSVEQSLFFFPRLFFGGQTNQTLPLPLLLQLPCAKPLPAHAHPYLLRQAKGRRAVHK